MTRTIRKGRKRADAARGVVVEIFSGVQGEGTHIGERHLFLRLGGCNWWCDYCDQPEARRLPQKALIEKTPGKGDFVAVSNPIDVATVLRVVQRLNEACTGHQALSITGGEPLMQLEFIRCLLPGVKRLGLRTLLETNGTLPEALSALPCSIDIISMDLKLRSATGRPMPAPAHEEFLRRAVRRSQEVYVKVVVSSQTTIAEVRRAAAIIGRVSKSVPLIIQPVTHERRGSPTPPSAQALIGLMEAACSMLPKVRVIPQTHKLLGLR